jgi:phage-related protein
VTKGFGGMVAGAARFAAKLATVGSAISSVTAVAGGLATASGALLALPAAGVAAAGVMAAVKLGADGAKKAFEGLKKSVDPLKAAVSSSFEKSLNPAVANLNQILPKLKTPLQTIVTAIGGMATQATSVAKMPDNMKTLNTVLMGTGRVMGNLRDTVRPLTQAFFDLVSVAAPGLENIGAGAGAAAQRFADWIRAMKESGELRERLEAGLKALNQFGGMLRNIWGIVTGVFKGISEGAGGVGGVLAPILAKLNEFINSTQGQAVLAAIGAALKVIGNALSMVLGPALMAVAPLIPPLLGLFAQVVTTIANGLLPVINFLAPGLAAIAGWISQNTGWLGPLAVAIGVVTGAMWLLNAALNANPIVLVISLIAALVVAFVSLWQKSEGFRNFFIGAWEAIKSAVGTAIQWIVDRWNGLVSAFEATISFFARIGRAIGEAITSAIKGAINFVIGIINGFISATNASIGVLNQVPGVNFRPVSHIPKLARGGFLREGGLVEVGERGREIVALPGGASVTSNRESNALLGGGVPEVRVFIGDRELRDLVRVELVDASSQTRRRATSGTGGSR